MQEDQIAECARRLRAAYEQRDPCGPLTDEFELDEASAYAVQRLNGDLRVDAGSRAVGWKVGLTSAAIQNWLGVDEPDFGMLFDDMVIEDGATADFSRLLQPRAEAEVAFILEDDLRADATAADVLWATAYILPAIEVVDSRVADWKIKWGDTVADNASAGMFVLGSKPVSLDAVDLRLAGMALRKNGQVVSTGTGAACLGHPVNAVAWLARTLGRVGDGLRAGDIVLTGALGPVTPIVAGDWLSVSIAGVGDASCRFR